MSYVILYRNLQNDEIGVITEYDEFGNPSIAVFETYAEAKACDAPILRISSVAIVDAP